MTGMSYVKQTETTAPSAANPAASLTRRELVAQAASVVVAPPHAKPTMLSQATDMFAPPSKLKIPRPKVRPKGLSAVVEPSKIPLRQAANTFSATEDLAFFLHGSEASEHGQNNVCSPQHHQHLSPIIQHTHSRHAHYGLPAKQPLHSTPRSADSDLSERRLKAMQLGVFKITESELRERYQFNNEIGAGEWGSIWAVEALKPMAHLPTSAYRRRQALDSVSRAAFTFEEPDQFRPLAVKLCKREGKSTSAARTKRLWNEFKVLRTLMDQLPGAEQVNPNSPNLRVRNDDTGWHSSIVTFYEFVLTPTLAMLAMPKYDEPMKVCLPESTCRNYFQQLLSAVSWLHQHHVCHNDIKVDNLLVTFDTSGLGRDTVTLVDFGFANRYDPQETNAYMSTDVWGTPEYLAPERIRGELHDERRSDVWALGIAFFEIFTGRTPFERHDERFNSKEKFEEYYQRAERGVWLGEWDLPAKTEDLIRSMLNVDPVTRFDAAEALLHSQYSPGQCNPPDSMDDLLQLPYEEMQTSHSTDSISHDLQQVVSNGDDTGDTDDMFGEILTETERLCLSLDGWESSLLASPGVGRTAASIGVPDFPISPSLSQVGMESRLTNLMAATPPWMGTNNARRGPPVPSAQRQQLLVPEDSITDNELETCQNGLDVTVQSAENLSLGAVGSVVLSTPTKSTARDKGPTCLRPFARIKGDAKGPMTSAAVSSKVSEATANLLHTSASSRQLFRARGAAGNTVASLAKRFDSTSLLPLPTQIAKAKGDARPGLRALAHKRSKSCTLAQEPIERRSIRHSTGAAHIESAMLSASVLTERTGTRARLFGQDRPLRPIKRATKESETWRTDSTVDSAILRTFDANESLTSKSSLQQSLASLDIEAEEASCIQASRRDAKRQHSASETSAKTMKNGEDQVLVTKLRKMASLASMLTKMIDETKSTILSPGRSPLIAPKTRSTSPSSHATVSVSHTRQVDNEAQSENRLRHEPLASERQILLVSASYSLDLDGAEKASVGLAVQPATPILPDSQPSKPFGSFAAQRQSPPSPSQVEGMYASFLLSQNVSQLGSGYQSPCPPPNVSTSGGTSVATPRAKCCSLASLFVAPSSPTFAHLLEKYGEHPNRQRKVSEAGTQPNLGASSSGMATRSSSTVLSPAADLGAKSVRTHIRASDYKIPAEARESVAVENATFEMLNPTAFTACCTVALSTDDNETIQSGSRYDIHDRASIVKADRSSMWAGYRSTKPERGATVSTKPTGSGRSKFGRLFRLVS